MPDHCGALDVANIKVAFFREHFSSSELFPRSSGCGYKGHLHCGAPRLCQRASEPIWKGATVALSECI